MATDIAVTVEDKPGQLAAVGEATGKAGVNIDGVCCFPSPGGKFTVHLLVEDAGGARKALEETGFSPIEEREVVVLAIEDEPGAMGEAARRVADAGVNLDLAYLATGTRLVLGSADVGKLRSAV